MKNWNLWRLWHRAIQYIYARYGKTQNAGLLSEFLEWCLEIERTEDVRNAISKNQISKALDEEKNIWKKLQHLGFIPKPKEVLYGFSPNELNSHFWGVSVSSLKETVDADKILENASQDGFKFKPVTSNDVILAIFHFFSEARGEDKIPQSVIVKDI